MKARPKWAVAGLICAVCIIAISMMKPGRSAEPKFYQVQYDPSDPSADEEDNEGTSDSSDGGQVQSHSGKRSGCEDKTATAQYCRLADEEDEKLLHLARPSGVSTPVAAHGASILSATLSVVRDENVAVILLTDPRDWMSVALDESLRDVAKRHLQTLDEGRSLISCAFGGEPTQVDSNDVTSSGRIVLPVEKKILVILCPLPKPVACCLRSQISSLAGRLSSVPVCIHVKVTMETPVDESSLPPLLLANSSVCKFGQFYNKVGLAALVNAENLAYFPQWIAYHRWMGFKLTIVYLLDDVDLPKAKKKLMPYLLDGSIVISAWNVTVPVKDSSKPGLVSPARQSPWKFSDKAEDIQERLMTSVFTDCLYRYRQSSEVMLIIDPHQYLIWRNRTGPCLASPCPAAVAPLIMQDILPAAAGIMKGDSLGVLSLMQAVFHPPVMPKEPEKACRKGGNRSRCLPMDISSAMRCPVDKGISSPRYAYDFQDLFIAWPGSAQNEHGQVVKAKIWGNVRLNSYHNRSLDCTPNILDLAMHESVNWTLLNTVNETVARKHSHDFL